MAQPGEAHQPQTSSGSRTQQEWLEELYSYVQKGGKQPVRLAIQALNAYPTNGELLLVTALAALIEERPDQSLRYQKRFSKHFLPSVDLLLLQALTWAQQSRWGQADRLIKENGLNDLQGIVFYFPFARA